MFSNTALISTLLCGLVAQVSPAQARDVRPTVAVANIEVGRGGWTVPPPQLGSTIAELLVDQLVGSQQFHVVDGEWLVPERELAGRAALENLRAAAERDQVDYLVLGSVTQFSTEQHGRHGAGILPLPFAGGALSRSETRTTVSLMLKILDVRTGEIVATTTGDGVGKRKSGGLGLLAVVHGLPLAGGGGSGFSGSRDAMLNDAVTQAVRLAAHGLAAAAARLAHEP
jgi:curli biogenesis system outer membrane secretion channel CsgG